MQEISSNNQLLVQTASVDSRIASVTVYRSGALVAREARVELEAMGSLPTELHLGGLPLSMDDSSVKVRILDAGRPGELPLATDIRIALASRGQDQDLPPPKDEELEQARLAELQLKEQLRGTEKAIHRLHGLSIPDRPRGKRGEPPPPIPTEARLALLDFISGQLSEFYRQQASLQEEYRKALLLRQELEARFQASSSARQAREHELRKVAVISLAAQPGSPTARAFRVSLEYLVPGAIWAPCYTLDHDPEQGLATLSMKALVCQLSGEDWNGVDIVLSTASALSWTELPELPALKLGRRQQPRPRLGWRPAPRGTDDLFADYDRARQALPTPEPGAVSTPRPGETPDPGGPEGEWLAMESVQEPDEEYAAQDSTQAIDLSDNAFQRQETAKSGIAGPPHRRKPRKASIQASFRAAAPPPPQSPPPAMAAEAPAPQSIPPPEPSALEPSSRFMDYGSLRMAGPDDPHRGNLRPAGDSLPWLGRAGAQPTPQRVLALVRRARRAAHAPELKALPAGHHLPRDFRDFDYAYAGESPIHVASDGRFHSIPLLARTARSSLYHVVVPALRKEAYRTLKLQNPMDAPLPGGPVDIYMGGDYLLSTPLHTVEKGLELELGLGVEQAVKVARNASFSEHTTGLINSTLELLHEVTIQLRNNLPVPARLEVRERLPVTTEGDKDVQVELRKVQPPWEPFSQSDLELRGGYRWRLVLKPGTRAELTFSYAVRIPASHELEGGNRREGVEP